MLLDDLAIDEGVIRLCLSEDFAQASICFPLGGGRVRAYVIHQRDDDLALRGDSRRQAFMQRLHALDPGTAPLTSARPAGVLASFPGTSRWSPRTHRDGVVLTGDAAGSVDPAFGCGLSVAARDARVLAEALSRDDDWRRAADAYSARRGAYYTTQLRLEAWMRAILYTPGPDGDAVREVALPRMSAAPDLSGLGPDAPSDDAAREALFGPLAGQLP